MQAGPAPPSPPPPSPPPPPPPPAVNETLSDLVADDDFDASHVVLSFDVDAGGVTSNVSVGIADIDANMPVSFALVGNAFTLSFNQGGVDIQQSFSEADIDADRSDNMLRVYSADAGGGDIRELVLLIPGEPTYNQRYVTLGIWNAAGVDASRELSFGATAFGLRTTDADMPTTGQATYTGLTLGNLDANNTLYSLAGDVQIDVDFASGSVNGAFTNMVRENSVTGGLSAWRDFTAIGNINAGTSLFSGTTETNDTQLNGNFNGGFFGPVNVTPAEVGGTWTLSGAGETAVGAFVGRK